MAGTFHSFVPRRHGLPPPFPYPSSHSLQTAPMDEGSTSDGRFGPSRASGGNNGAPLFAEDSFDVLEWFPAYQSCQRYFLNHSQHESPTQALCALINIRLPCQWLHNPVMSYNSQAISPLSNTNGSNASGNVGSPTASRTQQYWQQQQQQPHVTSSASTFVSVVPYIRRLVVTAFDQPAILHGFFGDDYIRGILPHVECERRNYLFAAKHGGWRSCKKQYDVGSGGGVDETVPFMKPLDQAKMQELNSAEKAWSGWLAMEDWMVGPRAPSDDSSLPSSQGHTQRSRYKPHDFPDEMPDGVPDDLAPLYEHHQS